MNKIVMITGATAGIGEACAWKFSEQGYNILITGRRMERLLELQSKMMKQFGNDVYCLCFDVQHNQEVIDSIGTLPVQWKKIEILINNAGLALGRDNFADADMEDWETMLQTNVNGLLYVSRAVLPFMIENNKGHIINMGSIAGKEVYENGNIYCASKFAVDAITRSMRVDLLKYRIKVTSISPGAVDTEFSLVRYKGDRKLAEASYIGYTPLSSEDIADAIWYTASLPEHVCINDLVITCTQQASTYYFNKNG